MYNFAYGFFEYPCNHWLTIVMPKVHSSIFVCPAIFKESNIYPVAVPSDYSLYYNITPVESSK